MKRLPLVAAEAAARLTLGSSSGTSAPRLGRDALAAAQSVVVSSINKPILTVLTTRTAPRRPRLRNIFRKVYRRFFVGFCNDFIVFEEKRRFFLRPPTESPPTRRRKPTFSTFRYFRSTRPVELTKIPNFPTFLPFRRQETQNDAARSPSRAVSACRYFNRFNDFNRLAVLTVSFRRRFTFRLESRLRRSSSRRAC